MKILHVSNFGDKHNGRLFWNQCFKISNGFIRNGHSVLNFSERDKSRAHITNKFNNNKKLQKDLIETINNFNPELIVLGHERMVEGAYPCKKEKKETHKQIRNTHLSECSSVND